MKRITFTQVLLLAILVFTFVACNKNNDKEIAQSSNPTVLTDEMMSEGGNNPDELSITENETTTGEARPGKNQHGHYLYTESNAAEINEILVYRIMHNGSLDHTATVASGGAGTGAALGSQGALVLDKKNNWLFAVNAGSNSVSSFKVHDDGSLTLAHTANTGGETPVSVSVYGKLLYVLNNGSDNIHGFYIGHDGSLTSIAGSTKSLSGSMVDAPQISFTPNGNWLVVTEKATNIVGTFRVKNNGSISDGIFTPSVGNTPFGFEFSRNRYMIVSNAEGGAAGAGSATSYITKNNGVPADVNGAVPNLQGAPCWVAVTKYGRYAYITNTASNSVSSYYVAPWGSLYLVDAAAAETGMSPLDVVVADNNYYVYVLNAKSNTISGYRRTFFGGLHAIGTEPGLPMPATGLATF